MNILSISIRQSLQKPSIKQYAMLRAQLNIIKQYL